MDLFLKNKVAIVTGGTKGIGGGVSTVLAQEGCNLVLNYRSDIANATLFANEVENKYGVKVVLVPGDMGKKETTYNIFKCIEETFGIADILINNAATMNTPKQMIWDITDETWERDLDGNLSAYFRMCREFSRILVNNNKKGRIVNVLSKAAIANNTVGKSCYTSNKAGEMGLTRQLAKDLVPYGIIVNGILPGSVRNTTMTQELYEYRCKTLPLGRVGEPIELGAMVAFLASERCQLAVGSIVDFTAGML